MASAKDLSKAIKSVTKAPQCREDTVMLLQGHTNWEEYLTPAPMAIAFLAELINISAKKDFSIKDGGPVQGFKYIRYPDSFRACLMQVCNSGWGAFNEAHKNMDKIFLHTTNVPEYVKTAVQILLQDDNEIVKNFLPDTLESIANIANDCVLLATSVENKFLSVTDLISELLETSTSAKQHYGIRLEEVKQIMEDEKRKKEMLELESKNAHAHFENLGTEMTEAKENFQKAMNEIPSGWESIAMDFVDGVAQSFVSMLNLSMLKAQMGSTAAQTGNQEYSVLQSVCPSEVYTKSPLLLNVTQTLNAIIQEDTIYWSMVIDPQTKKSKCDYLVNQIDGILTMMQDVEKCKAKTKAESICKEAKEICAELSKLRNQHKEGDKQNDKIDKLIDRIKKLHTAALTFDAKAKKETNTPAMSVTPPGIAKAQSESSASQRAAENARFKAELHQRQLEESRKAHALALEKAEAKNRELIETLAKLRRCDVQNIDFDTTIKLLAEGLKAMGDVQLKWRKLVLFFQMVSNIIGAKLKTSMDIFVEKAGNVRKTQLSTTSYSLPKFLKDMIYTHAFKASDMSNLVNMISGTYIEISNKYLMDRVNSLGKLMTLDPKDHEFTQLLTSLRGSCDDADESIRALVLKNKTDYELKAKARSEQIESMKAALPPPSKEEVRKNKTILDAGFQADAEEEEEDQY